MILLTGIDVQCIKCNKNALVDIIIKYSISTHSHSVLSSDTNIVTDEISVNT